MLKIFACAEIADKVRRVEVTMASDPVDLW